MKAEDIKIILIKNINKNYNGVSDTKTTLVQMTLKNVHFVAHINLL